MGAAAVNRDRLYSLFKVMVNHYSPSGREEELTNHIARYLKGSSLAVTREYVDDTRANLLIAAPGAKAETLFLGHIDTVPAFDIEQYEFHEKEGMCFGLGTADMKGGCAAMIEAFLCASENEFLPAGVMLALVVGEEETGDGTELLIKNHSFKNAIVGEPTGLKPCLDHYSYIEMIVRIFGYRQHAAMASRETNAIRNMLRFLLEIEDKIDREEETILNIRDLHSSESGFAVPDQCAAAVDLHIPPHVNASEYAARLERFASEHFRSVNAHKYEIDFPVCADGYSLSRESSFIMQLKKVYERLEREWIHESFKSHSDANILRNSGCDPVILGPGQLSKAHTIDESIDFREVAQAALIYTELLAEIKP